LKKVGGAWPPPHMVVLPQVLTFHDPRTVRWWKSFILCSQLRRINFKYVYIYVFVERHPPTSVSKYLASFVFDMSRCRRLRSASWLSFIHIGDQSLYNYRRSSISCSRRTMSLPSSVRHDESFDIFFVISEHFQ